MLRIGFDAKRLFNNFTGLGNYSRTLLKNLTDYYPDNEYFLYTPKVTEHEEMNYFLKSPYFKVVRPRGRFKFLWRTKVVVKKLQQDKVQIYHGLSHEIPVGIDETDIKTVVTIHDLIFKYYPAYYGAVDRKIYDLKFKYACQNANKIVAISENTKKDIIKFYKIDPDKITVLYQSCHDRFKHEMAQKTILSILNEHNVPEDFYLYVGSVIPRKNLLAIVKAWELLPSDLQYPIVVIGNGGAYKKKVEQYIREKNITKSTIFLEVEFEDLPALYQRAKVFIYPSYYEGFGIPIIEALFSKTPVISSKTSSMPEAAGPDSWLIDPDKPQEIAEGIKQILSDEVLRNTMIENGYEYAQNFQSELLTEQLMEVYEEVMKEEG